MYIKIVKDNFITITWDYAICGANHKVMMWSTINFGRKSAAVRAAKKMANKLNIEYREN